MKILLYLTNIKKEYKIFSNRTTKIIHLIVRCCRL